MHDREWTLPMLWKRPRAYPAYPISLKCQELGRLQRWISTSNPYPDHLTGPIHLILAAGHHLEMPLCSALARYRVLGEPLAADPPESSVGCPIGLIPFDELVTCERRQDQATKLACGHLRCIRRHADIVRQI